MRGSGKDSGATRLKKAGAGEVQEGKNKFVAPEMIILRRKGESDSTVTYEVLAVSLLGEQEISKDALKQGTLLRGQKVAAVEAVSEDREGLMRKAREAIKKDPEKWKHSRAWGRTTTQVEELYKAYGIKYQSDIAALLKGVTETTVWRNFKKLKLESGSDIEEKKTWGVISAELAKLPEGVKPNARKMARDTGIPNTTIISQLKKHEVERHNPGGREKTEEESGKYKGNKKGNDTWAKIKPFVEESIRSGTKINGSEITRRLNDKSVSLDMTLYHIRKRKEEIKEMQAKAGTEEPVAREEQKTDKRKARGDATWNKIKPFVEESIYNGAELDVSKITKRLGDEKISRAVVRYHIGKREKEIEMMRAEFEVGKIEESGSRTASGSIVTTAVVEKTGEKEIKTPGLSKDEEAKLDASASKGLVKGVGLSEDSGVSYHKTKKYMKAHGIEIKRGRARGKSTKEIGDEEVVQAQEPESVRSEKETAAVVQSAQSSGLELVVRKEVESITAPPTSPVYIQASRVIYDSELKDYVAKTVPTSVLAGLNKIKNGFIGASYKGVIEVVTEELKAINKTGTALFSEKSQTELAPEAMKLLRERLISDDDFLMKNGHNPVVFLLRVMKELESGSQSRQLYDAVRASEPRVKVVLQALNDRLIADGYY